jgi:hypothetical protein
MKSNNSGIFVLASDTVIFYICLAIVIAVAAFGIVSDVAAR